MTPRGDFSIIRNLETSFRDRGDGFNSNQLSYNVLNGICSLRFDEDYICMNYE